MTPVKNKPKAKPKPKVKPRKKNRFTSIEIAAPDRAGDTEREGKKSIPWNEDPEILSRLADVAEMMNKNLPSWQIAAACETSVATAKRDIARVRELWKADATERLAGSKDAAIAQYGKVIYAAWEEFEVAPKALKKGFLDSVTRAQERIDKVTGIADPVAIGGIPGQPVQVQDMDEVRKKRWEAIAARLEKIAEKEKAPDGNNSTGQATDTQ